MAHHQVTAQAYMDGEPRPTENMIYCCQHLKSVTESLNKRYLEILQERPCPQKRSPVFRDYPGSKYLRQGPGIL